MAAEDDFSGDLYGDLDLEDIDASQLEDELNEPPEPEPQTNDPAPAPAPAQNQYNYGQPPPANNGGYDQNSQGQGQGFGGSGASYGQPAFGGAGGSGGNDGQGSGMDRIKPNDMPDEGKMFIGGLNWETTDDGLKAYMSKYGEIDACTIMRDPSGRSRGFAFLTYNDPASVTKVMGEIHHLDGKQIDPKRAIPKAEHEKTAKVFVGGLAPGVTSESLKIFLHQFGEVHDATVMFDRETGRSKGFAFATFANEESVPIAMDASGIELEGKAIEIKKAQPRGSGNLVKNFNAPSGGRGFNNQQQQGAGMGMMGGGGGFDPNAMAMMYQNMMKGPAMGNMGMGFDPNAMAMMYQNMMKNMAGMNAPAINPNMAMRNGGMGMMGGMGGMGNMGGMGGMGNMGGMGMMGNGMGMMGNSGGMGGSGGMNRGQGGSGGQSRANVPNAPRGPAAMRGPGGSTTPQGGSGSGGGGAGAQRYSTQGNARAKPY